MEWLIAGVVGQLLALRLLTWILAWEPGHLRRVWRKPEPGDQTVRHARRRRLLQGAVVLFGVSTVVALAGVVLVVVG